MIRRLLIPLLGSGLLLAATASSVFAKCEGPNPPEFCKSVAVNLGIGGGEGQLQAGTLETVPISVTLGEQPYDATTVELVFARVADGTAIRIAATAAPIAGMWTADVNLPDGGTWTVVANVVAADGTATLSELGTIQVGKPPALPPSTVTPPPLAPTPPALPIALLLGGIGVAAIAGQLVRDRSRRRPAGVAGAAATADRA